VQTTNAEGEIRFKLWIMETPESGQFGGLVNNKKTGVVRKTDAIEYVAARCGNWAATSRDGRTYGNVKNKVSKNNEFTHRRV